MNDFDAILVGGGLQSGLIALAVLRRTPTARLAIVERDRALGGNHTWSFHEADLSFDMRAALSRAVLQRWPAYEVEFPNLQRRIERAYYTVTSATLNQAVAAALSTSPASRLLLQSEAVSVDERRVTLADGQTLQAPLVIDARGPEQARAGACGFQKFVGLELEVRPGHGRQVPLLMDARVAQVEGFRFVYTLPLSDDRVLIEDTVYSDTPALDVEARTASVLAYAQQRGFLVRQVARSEQGALPLPFFAPKPPSRWAPLLAGYAGGWFHPTTGYSLPCAAALAELIAACAPRPPPEEALRALRARVYKQARFFALLNRLLFWAYPDHQRWRVLERFHRLPDAAIERFYSLRTTAADRARLLAGRPPGGVRWSSAVSAAFAFQRGEP